MLNGISYDSYPKSIISEKIGMFFQNFVIFHASMRENVGFGDVKNINNEDKILYAIDRGGATRILQSSSTGPQNADAGPAPPLGTHPRDSEARQACRHHCSNR
jgi:ABC-type multidrug transport system fused ATPase/permease subunit